MIHMTSLSWARRSQTITLPYHNRLNAKVMICGQTTTLNFKTARFQEWSHKVNTKSICMVIENTMTYTMNQVLHIHMVLLLAHPPAYPLVNEWNRQTTHPYSCVCVYKPNHMYIRPQFGGPLYIMLMKIVCLSSSPCPYARRLDQRDVYIL